MGLAGERIVGELRRLGHEIPTDKDVLKALKDGYDERYTTVFFGMIEMHLEKVGKLAEYKAVEERNLKGSEELEPWMIKNIELNIRLGARQAAFNFITKSLGLEPFDIVAPPEKKKKFFGLF